jgi:hypothetical protein
MRDSDVTEQDFRRPEFRHAKPEDYEFRDDGKVVRKDRWENGIRSIVTIVGMPRGDFEIDDLVDRVRRLSGVHLLDCIARAREMYEGNEAALQCLDYVQDVIENPAKEPA